jgi:hypothetical protein
MVCADQGWHRMDDSDALEVYCPNCRHYVTPLKAAVNWYCPRCAWQFSDAEIDRRRGPQQAAEEKSSGTQRHALAPRDRSPC